MAYIPEKLSLTETLLNNYDLSTGVTSSVSSDISDYTKVSLQFSYRGIDGSNIIQLQQSNNNLQWSDLGDRFEFPIGTGNFTIDKSFFSAKYLKIDLPSVNSGTISTTLIAKR